MLVRGWNAHKVFIRLHGRTLSQQTVSCCHRNITFLIKEKEKKFITTIHICTYYSHIHITRLDHLNCVGAAPATTIIWDTCCIVSITLIKGHQIKIVPSCPQQLRLWQCWTSLLPSQLRLWQCWTPLLPSAAKVVACWTPLLPSAAKVVACWTPLLPSAAKVVACWTPLLPSAAKVVACWTPLLPSAAKVVAVLDTPPALSSLCCDTAGHPSCLSS